MSKILVMGQNPSLTMTDPIKAFVGTKSGNRLFCMLEEAGIKNFNIGNVCNDKTEKNKPLKRSVMVDIAKSKEFYERLKAYDKILAVGRQAEFTLEVARLHHSLPHLKVMYVPHPSGLNRTWNAPGKEKEVVEMIKVFINGGIGV